MNCHKRDKRGKELMISVVHLQNLKSPINWSSIIDLIGKIEFHYSDMVM